jgi:hypothetical protein
MATFAPNFNPQNINDDVFVFNFLVYNRNKIDPITNSTFVPAGMTFQNLGGELIAFPNPVIQRMSKQQYLETKQNYLTNLSTDLWTFATKETPIIDPDTGKTLWTYFYTRSTQIPTELTEPYDLANNNEERNEAQKKIVKFISSRLVRFPFFLPKSIPVSEVNFNSDNLLLTYCRHFNSNIVNINGNAEDIGTFFDCGTLLEFEAEFLRSVFRFGILDLSTFNRKRVIINGKETAKLEPLPNCFRCRSWVVYCSSEAPLGMPEDTSFKGFILDLVDDSVNSEEELINFYGEDAKFFSDRKLAELWIADTLNRLGAKWLCKTYLEETGEFDENDMPIKTEIVKCVEIAARCAEKLIEDGYDLYDSEEECIENCNRDETPTPEPTPTPNP